MSFGALIAAFYRIAERVEGKMVETVSPLRGGWDRQG